MKPLYEKSPRGVKGRLGRPGEYPYTRGIYPAMYSEGRLWTMRQYAGFGSAEATNARFRYLIGQGVSGLSVAFDLPTQLGYDPDHLLARGEVGRVGVSVATLDDMRSLFAEIPLDQVTTSMTINAPAMMLLALYLLVAEDQGVALNRLGGTVQNDILKEYIARGTYIYPPRPSMRLVTDLFAFCAKRVPLWNTISVSGYHIREAGSTAAQEIAFTLANARAYVQAAVAAGLEVDAFAPRISFFFACHNRILEEVAKFRAARRMWARIMRDTFGASSPKSLMLRFHTQTGGSTLTARQPHNNVVRTAYQALAAVLGGTQSLHTNALDEALGLPTEESVRIALRTQQILAYETGVSEAIDPLAGSYYLEHLTDELENEASRLLEQVEAAGGSVKAIESGFIQEEIEASAYRHQQEVENEDRVVVGVNRFQHEGDPPIPVQVINAEIRERRVGQLRDHREARDGAGVNSCLEDLAAASRGTENLFPVVLEAFRVGATVGEVCGVLRREWGEHR
ncbi:MAG: methylmalonyl-CoA mutase family protein [Truepera sp.]|nr:methylmalonyl-CoA mutase family protein [Truepera sp.]